jgi:hypothetical protein
VSDPLTILDRLRNEWGVIKGAPFSFVIASMVVLIFCSGAFWWYYGAVLIHKEAQIQTLQTESDTKDERMKLKDDLVSSGVLLQGAIRSLAGYEPIRCPEEWRAKTKNDGACSILKKLSKTDAS